MTQTVLDAKIPKGPIEDKWSNHKSSIKLVNPANKRSTRSSSWARAWRGAAAADPGRTWLQRAQFCIQDSPRRAHCVAAQGGINAAKNYQNDGDSVLRLFYDTVKGGDYERVRPTSIASPSEPQHYRPSVAQGVPFAREYGGTLANRSFGGAQVSRTFYARGQTGQQFLLGAYSALCGKLPPARSKCLRARRCSTWSWSTGGPAASSAAT